MKAGIRTRLITAVTMVLLMLIFVGAQPHIAAVVLLTLVILILSICDAVSQIPSVVRTITEVFIRLLFRI